MSRVPVNDSAVAHAATGGPMVKPVTATLEGYVAAHRRGMRRLAVLGHSLDPEDDARSRALLNEQQARLRAARALQADSVQGVLSKLDLWFADHLADGLDEPEIEPDRLIASVREDLRRLLSDDAPCGLCEG